MPPTPLILSAPPARLFQSKRPSKESPLSPPLVFQTSSDYELKPPSLSNTLCQPRPYTYSLSSLLELPRRLARPPIAPKAIGRIWTIVPEMEISLEDILSMRHISPISLKDFEQYLLFEEYGAENLYFVLWVKDYTTRFNANVSPAQLAHCIARAKATFFSSDSHYELNLSASRVSEFFAATGSNPTPEKSRNSVYSTSSQPLLASTTPRPSTFTPIYDEVEHMLRLSAHRFVRARSRNVNSQRAYCVLFGGLQTVALAFIPFFLGILHRQSRLIRFTMIPPLCMGLTVVICSLNGICIIIYFLGGSRQMHPFELHRPPISAPLPYSPHSPYQHSFTTADTLPTIKSPLPCVYPPNPSTASFDPPGIVIHGPYTDTTGSSTPRDTRHVEPYALPEIRPSSPICDVFEFETAGFIPSQDLDTPSMHTRTDVESTVLSTLTSPDLSAASPHSRRSSTPKLGFDFDSLPAKVLDPTSGPRTLRAARGRGIKGMAVAVFSPLTRIESPVVSRAQWEVVVRSAVVAMFVTLIITGISVASPV
ncbi:hypothetical protein FRC12_021497 [Ceratobasidium sp. 428]|nr:hypothetical protein FRC12_021497 [Ceratobasidium sp. 428]